MTAPPAANCRAMAAHKMRGIGACGGATAWAVSILELAKGVPLSMTRSPKSEPRSLASWRPGAQVETNPPDQFQVFKVVVRSRLHFHQHHPQQSILRRTKEIGRAHV